MLIALRAVASLLIGAGILMLGNGLLGIVLPIRLNAAGLPTEATGLVMAGYYAGLVLGAMYGKNVIARVGHIRAFAAFAAIAAAAALSHALWFDAVTWTVLRIITGFCSAGLFAAIESWINERSSNELRGRVLSLYMVTTFSTMACPHPEEHRVSGASRRTHHADAKLHKLPGRGVPHAEPVEARGNRTQRCRLMSG